MTRPGIREKLQEHLKQVEELKANKAKYLLACLLYTEIDLIWNGFPTLEERLDMWKTLLEGATDHDGDCVSQCCSCCLCAVLDAEKIAEETIEEYPDQSIEEICAILVATQPQPKFKSQEEMRDECHTLQEISEALDYDDEPISRHQRWCELSDANKERILLEVKRYV
jgi:hypothetical protein